MRVILPPLTNQYLNLTKNSSLAVGDRLSRSRLGVRRHDAQPDRAGDRDHRHHHGRLSVDLAGDERDHEFLQLAASAGASADDMSDADRTVFVRQDLVPERPAPIKPPAWSPGPVPRLLNSPTNILFTIVSALLLWFTIVPSLKFLVIDAVWQGKDRNACLAENAGHAVGACWPFVQAKFTQFIYGFYPQKQLWRVNLVFILSALLLLPLLIPRIPGQGPQRRPVLYRVSDRRLLPAAWRRNQRLRHQLDGGFAVGLLQQHRRRRAQAGRRRGAKAVDRTVAGAARQADRR